MTKNSFMKAINEIVIQLELQANAYKELALSQKRKKQEYESFEHKSNALEDFKDDLINEYCNE